jgi:hypothetical protein
MRRPYVSRLVLGACVAAVLVSCTVEPPPNRQSGGDHNRTQAIEMPVNRVIIDHCDQVNGDRDDWKYFTVTSPGIVKVVVNFDYVEAEAQVEVINSVGQVLSNLELPESTDILRQLSFQVKPGNYYLHFYCQTLNTDYSVEVKLDELEF